MAKTEKGQQGESPEAAMAMQGLQRKANYLESSFLDEEGDLTGRDTRLGKSGSATEAGLADLKKDIASIKSAVAGISAAFENLANELRNSAKKEEVERMGMRLERLGIEKMVTKGRVKKEFKNIRNIDI